MHLYACGLNYALDAGLVGVVYQAGTAPMRTDDSMTCPLCRSNDTIPIFYGFPEHDSMEPLLQAVDRGEIEMGGCVVLDNRPSRHCKNCGHYFGSL